MTAAALDIHRHVRLPDGKGQLFGGIDEVTAGRGLGTSWRGVPSLGDKRKQIRQASLRRDNDAPKMEPYKNGKKTRENKEKHVKTQDRFDAGRIGTNRPHH